MLIDRAIFRCKTLCKYAYITTNFIDTTQTKHIYHILTEYICFTRIKRNIIFNICRNYNLHELNKVSYCILIANILITLHYNYINNVNYTIKLIIFCRYQNRWNISIQ